jgi:ribA/ribD-fused uncharacterized protein
MTIDRFVGQYEFLSNFAKSPISLLCVGVSTPYDHTYGEFVYETVEHYYQANKTRTSDRHLIRWAETPGIAKRMGQKVQLRSDWEAKKLIVMRSALGQKFAPGSMMAERLLETGNEDLVEGNNWGDTFWGVDDKLGGENWLGWLLMAQRAFLRSMG